MTATALSRTVAKTAYDLDCFAVEKSIEIAIETDRARRRFHYYNRVGDHSSLGNNEFDVNRAHNVELAV